MKQSQQRRFTAYHESGHAVASIELGIPFRFVTIIPSEDEGTLGHVYPHPWCKSFRPDIEVTPSVRWRIECEVVVLYAGAAAASLLTKRKRGFDWWGAGRDLHDACNLLSRIASEQDELQSYMKMLTYRTRNLVSRREEDIVALAEKLMECDKLSSREARKYLCERRLARIGVK